MIIFKHVPPVQSKDRFIGLDLEVFGLNPNQIHRPTSGSFACLSLALEPDVVYVIQDKNDIQASLDAVKDCVWVIHNAKFDLTHLRRWADVPDRKKLWDTLLIERIMWGGYYDLFALEHLARRYLDVRMDKSLQKSFEKSDHLTEEQIQYAALDASIALRIALEQRKIIRKEDMRIWKEIDRPALWAYLNFRGFAIDVDAWRNLAILNDQRAKELDDSLSFNPRSPQQVKAELIKAGYKGLPNTVENTLLKYMRKFPDTDATKLATQILTARKFAKRASTYGMNFIEDYLEQDDGVNVINCSYSIIGTESGGTSSSSPNMQNIIARETNEFRKCFIARPGNVLLIADYSAQEPCISAYLAQDKRMIGIINSGKDIYIEVAKEIFGETIQKSDPRRQTIKSTLLGTNYGMSPYGLAARENIPVDEAEKLIEKYFKLFPGMKEWSNQQMKIKDHVETVMGRRVWLNPYSDQCERNALNHPIQGSARGDMKKRAIAEIYQGWDFDCPFGVVADIHDEIVLDVPISLAKEISTFVERVMIDVAERMCFGIKFKVKIVQGSSWGDKE